jgi:hypothetical protein
VDIQPSFVCLPGWCVCCAKTCSATNNSHLLFTKLQRLHSFRKTISPSPHQNITHIKHTPFSSLPNHQLHQSIKLSNMSRKQINLHLLRACALLANSEPERALQCTDYALQLASKNNLFLAISLVEAYRGLCFYEMGEWIAAKAALVRGASARSCPVDVEDLTRKVQMRIDEQVSAGEDAQITRGQKRRREVYELL